VQFFDPSSEASVGQRYDLDVLVMTTAEVVSVLAAHGQAPGDTAWQDIALPAGAEKVRTLDLLRVARTDTPWA